MSKKISLLIALMVALTGVLVTGCTAAVETSDSDSVQDTSASEQSTETKIAIQKKQQVQLGSQTPTLIIPW